MWKPTEFFLREYFAADHTETEFVLKCLNPPELFPFAIRYLISKKSRWSHKYAHSLPAFHAELERTYYDVQKKEVSLLPNCVISELPKGNQSNEDD